MNRASIWLIAGLLLALTASYVASQPPATRKAFLSRLNVGQAVHLHSGQNTTSIWLYEDDDSKPLARDTIKEIGEDYVVVATTGTDKKRREICLPLHSLYGIVVFKKSTE